jgi:protein-tyrosine phosphatase
MVLFALGAQRGEVVEDYLVTGQRIPAAGLLQAVLGRELDQISDARQAAFLVMAEAREEYLDAALDEIEREYGGLNCYLEQTCGLNVARRGQLQAQLLE